MPLIIVLPYLLIEALAFWGVSQLIGVGWALILLFVFLFGGLALAAHEMRSIAIKMSEGRTSAGRGAGDWSLVAAGSVFVALPGFVTSAIGALLIIPPTRGLVRGLLAKTIRNKIEDMGVRSFEMTRSYAQKDTRTYGSFSGNTTVTKTRTVEPDPAEEEEISRWSDKVNPEDFTDGKK
ncbi:FxsA family protein [Corynebacterium mendelii]|uniref:FxsA family protein n=1 Tax=Corynebacterium mendelii TaxID=2765362 RepID=A0A939E0C5_9CORY|nr:FxsA family protein [Corynebacterium mendelii]